MVSTELPGYLKLILVFDPGNALIEWIYRPLTLGNNMCGLDPYTRQTVKPKDLQLLLDSTAIRTTQDIRPELIYNRID